MRRALHAVRATPDAISAPAVVSRAPLPAPPDTGEAATGPDDVGLVAGGTAVVDAGDGTVVDAGGLVVVVVGPVVVLEETAVVVVPGATVVVVVLGGAVVGVDVVAGAVTGGLPPRAASTSAISDPAT